MNRPRAERRDNRYVKAMRRLREDRAQHGSDHSCPCFNPDGRELSRWADTPKPTSAPRPHGSKDPSLEELNAPTVEEWDDWDDPRA